MLKRAIPVLGLAAALACNPSLAQESAVQAGAVTFEQRCSVCHSIGGGDRIGPDLAGVTERRDAAWLRRMIGEPDKLIAERDPVVVELLARFNNLPMPNLGLSTAEVDAVLAHLADSAAAGPAAAAATGVPAVEYEIPEMMRPQARVWHLFLLITAAIVLVFAAIAFSTRKPSEVSTERAYRVRRVLFLVALAAAVGILAATLPDTPYAAQAGGVAVPVDRIVYVTARQYEFIFSEEPITAPEEIARVPRLSDLQLDAGTVVEFRVTSLDVNHGFGLFGPQRQIVAQTQAMPGYVNRLRVRLDEAGEYLVLCLEYCATGHHRMRTRLEVRPS